MRRLTAAVAVLGSLATACASGDVAPTGTPAGRDQPVTAVEEDAPSSTPPPATAAPTTSAPPSTATTSTAFAETDTTVTTDTAPGYLCPDLSRSVDNAEVGEVRLAGWTATGEAAWEIPIGNVLPAWAASDGEVVLGFPDGELSGIDIATCEGWSITVVGGISDVAVTESGMILAIDDGSIAAFAGAGRGAWRHEAEGLVYRFAGDGAGVAVFVDQVGDITGFDTGGDPVFRWGGASDAAAVAVGEMFVYRATGAEVAARPVGGDVAWATELTGVEALFAVPGTLLAQDGTSLHALEPATGRVRWSIPFSGEIAGPAVLAHGELHLAARHGSIGFDTLWHFDPADGSTVFRGTAPPNTEWFPEMDDRLLLQVGEDGTVAAIDMLQRVVWTVNTGANRIDRFTQAEVANDGSVVTLSFSAERF